MSIPLVFFLIPYAILVAIIVIFSLVNLYHLLHYGFFYFSAALITYLYLGVLAVIFLWAYQELSAVDWQNAILVIGR